jgi:hypothetical protein
LRYNRGTKTTIFMEFFYLRLLYGKS